MKNASVVCLYLVNYSGPSMSDLADAHLALTPASDAKTAGWILGHLCVTGDYVRRQCGRPALTPKEWGPKFTPGSHPSGMATDYPPMADLRRTFQEVYRDLAEIAPAVSEDLLNSTNPLDFARPRFPTLGSFLAYIMTGHLGYHLGQLSGWRSSAGMPLRPGATAPI